MSVSSLPPAGCEMKPDLDEEVGPPRQRDGQLDGGADVEALAREARAVARDGLVAQGDAGPELEPADREARPDGGAGGEHLAVQLALEAAVSPASESNVRSASDT
jgi:hypothetical protein